jgi:hypothetical protein
MRKIFLLILVLLPALSFAKTGEKMVYYLKLGFVKGGEAEMDITDTTYLGQKAKCYYLKAKTTGITDVIFNVYDIYETIANSETLLPYKSIRNVKERNYKAYNEVTYFHNVDSIFSKKNGWRKAPKDLLDIVTVFFYFTKGNYIDRISQGEVVTLPTLHAEEINNINIKYLGTETIDTKLGQIDCYVIAPQIKTGKIFRRSDGIRFYITKDTKIPVLLEFETKAGNLKAILADYDVN